ncbi:hypothetical protein CHRY9390_02676 [Chryseobacterium aquaeductus]|uniref:SIR2-like domain-containing protein n=1 Tax=Chryseobacterium aquaeductus TaxID=2675056 RepID=A0A9N8MQB1_9FLAO|nr:SIR2 family protein [Chryseobacterium aquaeductus]CAA7331958.1 hypothetical protein CHRY9390_02676 [Chryseobacterium potabilaquae]CAD7813571.1 hypothetical protein CHRY9390_02676 [Chryseobacterium aquaeductus]
MKALYEDNEETINFLEEQIFPKIYEGNTILFLGAGSSVTEKKFLGKEIIDYYEEKLQINLETNDLVEFLDRAINLDTFNRYEFDQYIKELLSKLKPTEYHKKIVSLDWRQIITTNLDLILENSYNDIVGTPEEQKEIIPVRNTYEFNQTLSNDQIKYIKLNGCISDVKKYKFIFSSADFSANKKFYNLTIRNLSNLSDRVNFLAIGYSFTDGLSKQLLSALKVNNIQKERVVYNINPHFNHALIPFLEENNIVTIALTTESFFENYTRWESNKVDKIKKKSNIHFYNNQDHNIFLENKLALRLKDKLFQLCSNSLEEKISPQNFYKGEIPNYSIIKNDYDIIKSSLNKKIKDKIYQTGKKDNLIPILFISGNYGIGKTTSTYRAIKEVISEGDFVCFEIIDSSNMRYQDLQVLFSKCATKNIILFIDYIERDSIFKELTQLRLKLSAEQLDYNIIFVAPIRDNNLNKFISAYRYKNIEVIPADHLLTDDEIKSLIKKLKLYNIISIRDKDEENNIFNQIKFKFGSDPYVALLGIIENNKLDRVINDVLSFLPKDAKDAFVFTSLLYQYNIPMPGSILKKVVTTDWKTFKENILDVDCKGILINHIESPHDTNDDLFFRTKHPIISQKTIETLYKNKDRLFTDYLKIVRVLNPNDEHAKIFVDLIKFLKKDVLDKVKIDLLFEEAAKTFETNQNFTIQLAMNLEQKKDLKSLMLASEKLKYIESITDRRNTHIIHRRGVIDFAIAKLYHKDDKAYLRDEYINSAREFFQIKQLVDTFSSYSYFDFIKLELWVLNKIELTSEEKILQHITVQELFIKAIYAVNENLEKIITLKNLYIREIEGDIYTADEIIKHFELLYENVETRPFALIFKLNCIDNEFFSFSSRLLKSHSLIDVIDELHYYTYLDSVKESLFNYYSKRTYLLESRIKLNTFKDDPYLEKNVFNYNFTFFIKECYDYQFSHAKNYLKNLSDIRFVNLKESINWLDDETLEPKEFEGSIDKKVNSLYIYIPSLGQRFRALKNGEEIMGHSDKFSCNLEFTPTGIIARNLKKIPEVGLNF